MRENLAKGNARAALWLANIYSLASRLQNCEKAREWLKKAADLGQPEAIEMVLNGVQRVPYYSFPPDENEGLFD